MNLTHSTFRFLQNGGGHVDNAKKVDNIKAQIQGELDKRVKQ